MMRIALTMLFVLALLAGLILSAPARLVYDALGSIGVQAGLVQGSLWNGQALRVSRGPLVVRQVETTLDPASLLSGRMRIRAEITDPKLQVRMGVSLGSNRIEIEDARGVVTLSAVSVWSPLPALAPADAVAHLEGVSLSLDRDGKCLTAEGAMMSPALADLGVRYGVDLPIVDMTLSCVDEHVAIGLTGTSPMLDLEGMIVLDGPQPSYRLQATPRDPAAGPVLSLLGFQAEGADWIAESGVMGEG